jgi:hypothetical protein
MAPLPIPKYPLTINNNGLNDSFSIFRHGGIALNNTGTTGIKINESLELFRLG